MENNARPEGSTYPTYEEVQQADHEQLARWYRFLPSPGSFAVGGDRDEFERGMRWEASVLDRIVARFTELGGWNPELSKKVGW